ncbi:MAG: hypothetical protein NT076_00290, partial [Candidatus Pacearchaeota archaeon]|nr:hypothetical protein [Candidatus Pacearchaeota archaeon]
MEERGLIIVVGAENHEHMKGVARAVNKGLVHFPDHKWVYACHDLETAKIMLRVLGPDPYDIVVEPEIDASYTSELLTAIHPKADTVVAVREAVSSDGNHHGKNGRIIYISKREIHTP